ncbi:hypothetical protein [Bifidobacterium crudilactis]
MIDQFPIPQPQQLVVFDGLLNNEGFIKMVTMIRYGGLNECTGQR